MEGTHGQQKAWEDFGQRVELSARIREILLNYPEVRSAAVDPTRVFHGSAAWQLGAAPCHLDVLSSSLAACGRQLQACVHSLFYVVGMWACGA